MSKPIICSKKAEIHDGCLPKNCLISEIRRELLILSLEKNPGGKYSKENEARIGKILEALEKLKSQE